MEMANLDPFPAKKNIRAARQMRSRRSLRRPKSGRGSKDVGSDSCNGSLRTTERAGDDPRPPKAKVPETMYINVY